MCFISKRATGSLLIFVSGFVCADNQNSKNDIKEAVNNSIFKEIGLRRFENDDVSAYSECDISLTSVNVLEKTEDFSASEPIYGIDPDSGEQVVTQTVSYNNGDTALVRQSFCYLYNFETDYFLMSVSKENFNLAINRIDNLIVNVDQDYKLKTALADVVDLMMNLNNFAISDSFEHGLPAHAVISSQYVEHGLSFKAANETDMPAVIDFYFSLGDEE